MMKDAVLHDISQYSTRALWRMQGEMLQPDEAIKMVNDCADSKGRIWCEDFAALLQ